MRALSLYRTPVMRRRTVLLFLLSPLLLALQHCITMPTQGFSTSRNFCIVNNSLSTNKQQTHRQQRPAIELTMMTDNDDESTILTTATSSSSAYNEEAQRLLDKVKQMRMEIAGLTGQTIEDVEREATEKKAMQQENIKKSSEAKQQSSQFPPSSQQRNYIVPVPETVAEQIQQAANAIERAHTDGEISKQIIRFAFVPIVISSNPRERDEEDMDQRSTLFVRNDQDWPGGIQQIYREAAQPYTYKLLQQLRIKRINTNDKVVQQQSYRDYNKDSKRMLQEQTLWDFDGSAIITAKSQLATTSSVSMDATNEKNEQEETTASADIVVQALVHPNTDDRYFNDIQQMDQRLSELSNPIEDGAAAGGGGVNLIINPFWNNATSWGYNIFAPNAQQQAKDIIFSGNQGSNSSNKTGYIETYSIITKTVRGEDCIAIKAYPYDWQLYAYIEMYDERGWATAPYMTTIHLGSTTMEPVISDFVSLLNNRTEFKYSKNMRQMQRTMNQK